MIRTSGQSASITQFHKSKLVWFGLIVSGLILLISLAVHSSSGSSAGSEIRPSPVTAVPVPEKRTEIREINLQPYYFSDWICLNAGDKWSLDTPGWMEYELESGRRMFVPDGVSFDFGKIPGNVFRIRGAPGMARLRIGRR